MIFVQRGTPPAGFIDRASKWKTRFEEVRIRDGRITIAKFWARIRAELSVDAIRLFEIFHGKCAFCESYMSHVSSANIEHYRPKSNVEYTYLAFEWDNWLLACSRCNSKKWIYFPYCGDAPCLIDPTKDEPDKHIQFSRSLILGKTQRGEQTIKILGLNRSPLEDERVKWLSYIKVLLLLCLVDGSKQAARNMLIWCMQDEAPYAAMTRAYLKEEAPLLASGSHTFVNIEAPIAQIEEMIVAYRKEINLLL